MSFQNFNNEWGAPAGQPEAAPAQQQPVPQQQQEPTQFFPASFGEQTQQGSQQQQANVRISATPTTQANAPVSFNTGMTPSNSNGGDNTMSSSGQPSNVGVPIHQTRFGFPEDDLPLLEELGIYPDHIMAKASAVLHPMKAMQQEVVEDTDLAGPVVFAVMLGCLLSLQGKVEFSAIYSLGLIGVFLSSALLTLMSDQSVGIQFVISALGYCLLPCVLLAVVRLLGIFLSSPNVVMVPISLVMIFWSGWCCSQMFVTALQLNHQRYLLLYPAVLFYAIFAAITIF